MNTSERVAIAIFAVAFFGVIVLASYTLTGDSAQASAITAAAGIFGAVVGGAISIVGNNRLEERRAVRESHARYYAHLRGILDQLESQVRILDSSSTTLALEGYTDISSRGQQFWDMQQAAIDEIMRLTLALPDPNAMAHFRKLTGCHTSMVSAQSVKHIKERRSNLCADELLDAYLWIGAYRNALFAY